MYAVDSINIDNVSRADNMILVTK